MCSYFLDLRWNNISNGGAKYLLQALEENSSLKNILLEGNHIHSELRFAIGMSAAIHQSYIISV